MSAGRENRETARAFEVWAPTSRAVQVEVAGERVPMMRGDGGRWRAALPEASAEVEYRIVLDGGAPLPDPRSPSQPLGVHGPSRLVDHGAFRWSNQRWQAPPLARRQVRSATAISRRAQAFPCVW